MGPNAPASDWEKLLQLEPFTSSGLPDPAHAIAIFIEDGDTLIAANVLVEEVIWHFAIAPQAQKNPIIFGQLIADGIAELQAHSVPNVHATIADSLPDVAHMAERLGFVKAPGNLYLLAVPPAPPASEV